MWSSHESGNSSCLLSSLAFAIALGAILGCSAGGSGGRTSQDAAAGENTEKDGWFETGQDADILLSGIDFNKTGGPLLFNHPAVLDTDGRRLVLADRFNNRVLIWNTLPTGNDAPDLLLGQETFSTNQPGTGMDELNWPVGVSVAGEKLVVTDCSNERLLIWTSFPIQNKQAADLIINFKDDTDPTRCIRWPWAIWTDGTKLIATSTQTAKVLFWNSFPSVDNQPADFVLSGRGSDGADHFGTPRSIGTDGETYLVIGDHNAKDESASEGNFYWNIFPTSGDDKYDFFMSDPARQEGLTWGGAVAPDGRFVTLGMKLFIWDQVPTQAAQPDLQVGIGGSQWGSTPCNGEGYVFQGGDGSSVAVTDEGQLFVSLCNGNKIVVYNSIPTGETQCPDFAIGAPDIETSTLETNFIITNGRPATDGTSLFVTSDHDNRLFVWSTIPTSSGTHPDHVLEVDFGPWDNAIYKDTFVAAGSDTVQIWSTLPRSAEPADVVLKGSIGSANLEQLQGVDMDDKYFYLASGNGTLWVWEGLPNSSSDPVFTIPHEYGLRRISSDGEYLAVVLQKDGHSVKIYRIADLSDDAEALLTLPATGASYGTRAVEDVLVADGHLFMADAGHGRVLCWRKIEDAIAGVDPDTILGKADLTDVEQRIGKNSLYTPAALCRYGNRLWVAEMKFAVRILGFQATSD